MTPPPTTAIALDATIDGGETPEWDEYLLPIHRLLNRHADRYRWLTTTACWTMQQISTYLSLDHPVWASAQSLLEDATERRTHYQLDLPEMAPGATGHLTLNNTRHSLICLPHGSGNALPAAQGFPGVHPQWVWDQGPTTWPLLAALWRIHVPDSHFRLSDLPHDQSVAAIQPLLALPTSAKAALAGLLEQRTSQGPVPTLDQIIDIAHALR